MYDRYILQDGKPIVSHDLIAWSSWLETADRTVARDTIGESKVSTVFLGLDHQFGSGPPLLFETMVFGGPLDGEQEHYSTRQQALAGHAEMLRKVREQP